MPKNIDSTSPLLKGGDTTRPSFQVLVGGADVSEKIQVVRIEVEKEINKVAKATIELAGGLPYEQKFENIEKFEPGKDIKINAGYEQKNKPLFEGIVVNSGTDLSESGHSKIVVHCSDKAVKMTLNRKNELYKDKKDSDIIKQIVGKYGLSPDVEATGETHKKMVQYYATDWDFCLTRAEYNGKVVVTDNNKFVAKKPKTSGTEVTLMFGEDIIDAKLGVDVRSQIKSIECTAWDHTKQKLLKATSSEPSVNSQGSMTGSALAGKMSTEPYTMHLTGPMTQGDLKNWADNRLLLARLSRIKGSLKFQGNIDVKPNTLVKVDKLTPFLEGEGYVSKVIHVIEEGNWTTEATLGLAENPFSEGGGTESKDGGIHMPHASGQLPGINGLYNGVVKKIHADDDGDLRVLIDVPVINEGGAGLWARLANLYATNKSGSFFYPEIGDEVLVGFLQGDPRFPVIIGSLYGKKKKAPYEPDSTNKVKAIVSREQLKLIFKEDKKDIVIETPAGNRITLTEDKKKIIIEDQNKNLIEMSTSGIKIDTPFDIKVTAKGKISMEAMMDVSIKGTTGFKIAGLKGDITADTQLNAKGTAMAEFSSSGMTTVKGSIVMIN